MKPTNNLFDILQFRNQAQKCETFERLSTNHSKDRTIIVSRNQLIISRKPRTYFPTRHKNSSSHKPLCWWQQQVLLMTSRIFELGAFFSRLSLSISVINETSLSSFLLRIHCLMKAGKKESNKALNNQIKLTESDVKITRVLSWLIWEILGDLLIKLKIQHETFSS